MGDAMTPIFIVMGNDYPAAVFSTQAFADRYVDDRKRDEARRQAEGRCTPIHWSVYTFPLDQQL
jgi:hypothetical protein